MQQFAALPGLVFLLSCATSSKNSSAPPPPRPSAGAEMAQVTAWSRQDLDFFLHGSMSTEVVPETVLRAFIGAYPDLFPSQDLSHLGLIPDPAFGWPVGFSRAKVPHLGGLSAVGVNCAACHVGEQRVSRRVRFTKSPGRTCASIVNSSPVAWTCPHCPIRC